MTIRIEIFGDNAFDALDELARLVGDLTRQLHVSGDAVAKQAVETKPTPAKVQDEAKQTEEAPAAPKRRGRPPKAKVEDTGTKEAGEELSPTSTAMTETADENVANEDDEFAAFKNAMEKADADDDRAAASVPARKWTDADLSALNNQAAQKIGPARVPEIKAVVAKYVPDGEVPHSRNIPEEDRATYAREIEELAGIEFAG